MKSVPSVQHGSLSHCVLIIGNGFFAKQFVKSRVFISKQC